MIKVLNTQSIGNFVGDFIESWYGRSEFEPQESQLVVERLVIMLVRSELASVLTTSKTLQKNIRSKF